MQAVKIQTNVHLHQSSIHNNPCYFHPNNKLSAFCKHPKCIQPLCIRCISIHEQEHLKNHTESEIVDFNICLNEAYQSMAEDSNTLVEYINQIESKLKLIIDHKLSQNAVELIERARQEVKLIIDSHFNSLTTYVLTNSPELQKLQTFKVDIASMEGRWEGIMKELDNLSNEHAVTQLIYFYQGDVSECTKHYLSNGEQSLAMLEDLISKYSQQPIDIPQFVLQPEHLSNILKELQHYAHFQSAVSDEYVNVQQNDDNEHAKDELNDEYQYDLENDNNIDNDEYEYEYEQ